MLSFWPILLELKKKEI